jgi:hypothetical protein
MLKTSPCLLIRPRHLKHESLRGYVSRVSGCNGSSPILEPALASLRATTSALDEIATLTDTLDSILESHCSLHRSEQGGYSQVVFGDGLLPTNQVWMQRRVICPLCLAKNGISQCCWELREYDVCHLHGCYMVGSCHACKRPLSWASASKNRCACGLYFTELETNAAPRARRTLCRLLANAASETLYRPDFSEKIIGAITPLNWFFLFENFIQSVLIPGFCQKYKRTASAKTVEPETLVEAIMLDEQYCRYLRQTIFLHAARDPMTMAKMLRSDITHQEMGKYFDPCLNNMVFHDVLFTLPRIGRKDGYQETYQPKKNRQPSHSAQLRRVQDFFPTDFALEEVE